MNENAVSILKLIWPLIAVEIALKIFCFYRLKKDEARHMPKAAWFFIILLINTVGPLLYLIIGRKKD